MKTAKIRIITNILATIIGIIFVILTFYLKRISILLLSIEVILLPTIYIISNIYVEEYIKEGYNKLYDEVVKDTTSLSKKLHRRELENERLKAELGEAEKKLEDIRDIL